MSAAELMANLSQLGIRLEAHGDRLRYSPRSAVTPELADRMKAHKRELLAILRPRSDAPPPGVLDTRRAADAQRAGAAGHAGDVHQVRCDRCGSTDYRDTVIHGGQSVRRDCSRCRRFIDFPRWNGTC